MSIAEIIPAIQSLSRDEKVRIAKMLLEDLAREESQLVFKEEQVYPIYTPEFGPEAAAQLARLLEEEARS
jgi:hypothetical protein